MKTIIVLLIVVVCMTKSYGQQEKSSDTNLFFKTNMIEEVSVTKDLSIDIDTTGLEISFILDQKRKIETTDQPCSQSDFFIAYNNNTGIYFSMGCVWTPSKFLWKIHLDTLNFYKPIKEYYIKQMGNSMNSKQICNYILNHGEKQVLPYYHSHSDYLLNVSRNIFMSQDSINGEVVKFVKSASINDCNLVYYNQIIRK